MGLLQSERDSTDETLTIDALLSYELSGIPCSLFDDAGDLRIAKSKSKLKNKFNVECGAREIAPQATILDGSALLWTVNWPAKGAAVGDFIENFKVYLKRSLRTSHVYFQYLTGILRIRLSIKHGVQGTP